MKNFRKSVFTVAFIMILGAVSAFEWKFNDGGNYKRVKENTNPAMNGQIYQSEFSQWAREDDRGWFLTMQNGGRVVVADTPELAFNDGFYLSCRFMVDLSKINKSQFANLVTKGDNFDQGYSVMVYRDGRVLIYLKGITPAYALRSKIKINSMREYKLEIFAGNGEVITYLDGEEVDRYKYTGNFDFNNGKPLRIGQMGGYAFTGAFYNLILEPYKAPAKVETVKKKSRVIPDNPAGTVWVNDFTKFNEQQKIQIVTGPGTEKKWSIRNKNFFLKDGKTVLHPPRDINVGSISYNPNLKGNYDIYMGMRISGEYGSVKFSLSDNQNIAIIRTLKADGQNHFNHEIPLFKNVKMDDVTLTLTPTGENAYIGYIKFVPASTRKIEPQAEEKVQIFKGNDIEKFDSIKDAEIAKQIKSGYFSERHYVDKTPMPKISAASEQRGFVVAENNYMDLIFDNSIPKVDNPELTLSAKTAKGEFENIAFSIFALKDLKNISIEWKKSFPKSIQAELFAVKATPKRVNNYHGPGEFINAPQYLEQFSDVELKKNTNLPLQIVCHAPENIPAGTYSAELLIKADNSEMLLPVSLTVRNFSLAQAKGYDLSFWIGFDGKSDAEIEAEIKSLADHNFTSLVVMNSINFKNDAAGKKVIDFEKSPLITAVKYMKKYNLHGRLHIGTTEIHLADPDRYKELMQSLEDYANKHEWPARVYTCFDEVSSHPETFPQLTKRLQDLKDMNLTTHVDHIYYKTTRPIQKEIDAMSHLVDVFILRYNTRGIFYADKWDEIEQKITENGKELIAYNSNNGLTFTQPAMMRFANGWFFRSFGKNTRGQFTWAWNWYSGNPYTDLDGSVDWVYIFPARGNKKGGVALNYELMREGIDDLRYIITLENLIAEARAKNLTAQADEAQKLLDDIAGSFDKKTFEAKSVFIDSKFEEYGTNAKGQLYASGEFNLPNGWKNSDYGKAREKVANMIEKLIKIVGSR